MSLRGHLLWVGVLLGAAVLLLLSGGSLMLAEFRHLVVDEYGRAREIREQFLSARYHALQIQRLLAEVSVAGDASGLSEAAQYHQRLLENLRKIESLDGPRHPHLTLVRNTADAMYAAGVVMAKAHLQPGREVTNRVLRPPVLGFDERCRIFNQQLQLFEVSTDSQVSAIAANSSNDSYQAAKACGCFPSWCLPVCGSRFGGSIDSLLPAWVANRLPLPHAGSPLVTWMMLCRWLLVAGIA